MRLRNRRIAYLLEDGFEDLEFWVPLMRLQEEGAQVVVVAPKLATYRGKGGLEAKADLTCEAAKADEFDAVVVPGGWAPDKLRRYAAVKALVRGIYE